MNKNCFKKSYKMLVIVYMCKFSVKTVIEMKFMYTNKMYLPPVVAVIWKGRLFDVGVHLLTGG